jgi:hypothetical protein
VYLQGGRYHLVSPCLYLAIRKKQKSSSGPLRLLLPQVRISLLLFCLKGPLPQIKGFAVSSLTALNLGGV